MVPVGQLVDIPLQDSSSEVSLYHSILSGEYLNLRESVCKFCDFALDDSGRVLPWFCFGPLAVSILASRQ